MDTHEHKLRSYANFTNGTNCPECGSIGNNSRNLLQAVRGLKPTATVGLAPAGGIAVVTQLVSIRVNPWNWRASF